MSTEVIPAAKLLQRIGPTQIEELANQVRWASTEGRPVCPKCGSLVCYRYRARRLWLCKDCRHQFSVLSGTALSNSKLPLKTIFMAVHFYNSGAKGMSALQLTRLIGCQYKTAFVLFHKIREVVAREVASLVLTGEVEIDGAYFGGYTWAEPTPTLPNGRRRTYRRGERKVVVVMRERGGRTIPVVVNSEFESAPFIRRYVAPDAVIHADGAHAWDHLEKLYSVLRLEHKYEFKNGNACTNWAESYFSLLRRAHRGIYHRIGGKYLQFYASEIAWKQDHRHLSELERLRRLLSLLLMSGASEKWSCYWQNRRSEWERDLSPSAVVLRRIGQTRKCLSCGNDFMSAGKHNRLCPDCSKMDGGIAA